MISFTPKARPSVVDRPDLFVRYGRDEQDALAAFDFLNLLQLEPESDSSRNGNSDDDLRLDLDLEAYELLHPFVCDSDLVEGTNKSEQSTDSNNNPGEAGLKQQQQPTSARMARLGRKSNSFDQSTSTTTSVEVNGNKWGRSSKKQSRSNRSKKHGRKQSHSQP